MALVFEAQSIPLKTDDYGTVRVGNTRVRLDTVVYAFNQGYTAEEIVSQYPVLNLADVYMIIAYYLNNQDAVDEYVGQRKEEEAELQKEIEAQPGYKIFRERLLTRRKERLDGANFAERYHER